MLRLLHQIDAIPLFCVLVLCLPFSLVSQHPFFINYDVNDGLPSSEVYAVEIDEKGQLWFATDRGIGRYNGYEFTIFTQEDGLPGNTVLNIIKSPQGQLWLVEIGGKLSYVEKGKIHAFAHNEQLLKQQSSFLVYPTSNVRSWIEGLAWSPNGEQYLWPSRKSFHPTLLQVGTTANPSLETIDSKDLATTLTKIKLGDLEFFIAGDQLIPGETVRDDYFYSSYQHQEIYHCLAYDQTIHHHRLDSTSGVYIPQPSTSLNEEINTIYLDTNQALLVGTNSGLLLFPNGDLQQRPHKFLPQLSITDIQQDQESNYWITTLQKGIFQIPSLAIQTIPIDQELTLEEKIWSLRSYQDQLFVGTSRGKVFQVDPDGKAFLLVDYNQIIGIASGRNLRLPLLFFDEYKFHFITNQFTPFRKPFLGKSLLLLSNGCFLSYGHNNFAIYDSTSIKRPLLRGGIPDRTICAIEQDSIIWIGTNQGLYQIKNYQYEKHEAQCSSQLGDIRINDLTIDHQNKLWIATLGKGLFYQDGDSLVQITSPTLSSNMVNCLFLENDSILWVGTNNGLDRIRLGCSPRFHFKSAQHLTTQDGLLSNFINDITKWNNQITVATNGGINYFSPQILSQKTYAVPQIYLDQVNVNHKPYPDLSEKGQFSYDQNNFHFQFTGILYQHPNNRPFYRYRLYSTKDRQPTQWIYTNDRNAHYNDLAPGQYTFEVAAQNRNGNWTCSPIQYEFAIQPHFSQTLLFQVLLIMSLGGLTHWFYQLRHRQQQRLALAELKTQRAELRVLRNQMNPHFIYNVLNSIQNFIIRQDVLQANHYLTNFSRLIRNSLQFSRSEHISIAEEIDFLENYLCLEQMRFPKQFTYKIHFPKDFPIHQYYLPAFLIQPLVENAVKHAFTKKDNQGQIEITFDIRDNTDSVQISIRDNGVGISFHQNLREERRTRQSLGLSILQQQIDIINTQLSTPIAGLKLIDIKKEWSSGTGTLAILTLPIYHAS